MAYETIFSYQFFRFFSHTGFESNPKPFTKTNASSHFCLPLADIFLLFPDKLKESNKFLKKLVFESTFLRRLEEKSFLNHHKLTKPSINKAHISGFLVNEIRLPHFIILITKMMLDQFLFAPVKTF